MRLYTFTSGFCTLRNTTTFMLAESNTMSAHHSTHTMKRSSRTTLPFLLLLVGSMFAFTTMYAQDDDPLFRAMQDELSRSMERLQLEGQEKPYFIEYRVKEDQGYSVSGSFGALVNSEPYFSRNLVVEVRTGTYSFDNTGFLSRADLFDRLGPGSTSDLTIENNYMALRRDLWLATDKTYKTAIEQGAAKRGFLESRVEKDTLPDFARETPTTIVAARIPLDFDVASWEEKIRRLSAIAKNYPNIQESSVAIRAATSHLYLLNNEGTRVRTGEATYNIIVTLSTQAEDGLSLQRSANLFANTAEELPSEEEIAQTIRSLAESIQSLQTAATLDETYIGPVLLVEEAACELFQYTLVPHLAGSRLPLLEDESLSAFVGGESELIARIKRPIMPRYFSIYDDPNVRSAHGTPLAGHYTVDYQGVMAQHVSIIENGVLKDLPTSRRPGKVFPHSNGHGRGLSDPGTAIGNLFVKAPEGKSYEELKAELLQACKDQALDYGIIVQRMSASAKNSLSGGGISVRFGVGGPAESTMAIRVYLDGREEVLRGVSVDKLNLRTLKDILAVGSDYHVLNTSTKPHGSVTFSTVPASIIAPSVLLEEAEVIPSEQAKEKPALLTNPYFAGKK